MRKLECGLKGIFDVVKILIFPLLLTISNFFFIYMILRMV